MLGKMTICSIGYLQTNILVNGHGEACLVDFGLATVLQNTLTATATRQTRGTIRWMAPELLHDTGFDTGSGCSTIASDMYAVAMVLLEVRSSQALRAGSLL
jgi:serine/threonine protein kinase